MSTTRKRPAAVRGEIESALNTKAWDSERQVNVETAWTAARLADEIEAPLRMVQRILDELVREGRAVTRRPRSGEVLYKRPDAAQAQWQTLDRHIAGR